MRLAAVVPPGAQGALPEGMGAYFAFADELMESSESSYSIFFKHRDEENVLIIDHPIYENSTIRVDPLDMKILGKMFKPDFMIIPDVRGDCHGTLGLAQKYLAQIDAPYATGVVQGSTLEECQACAKEFYASGIRRFALPKDLRWRTEFQRSDILARLGDIIFSSPVHLLGADWPYRDESFIAERYPQVWSVDTAEPGNAAMEGHRLAPRAPKARRADWREQAQLLIENQATFHSNIGWLRNKINDH